MRNLCFIWLLLACGIASAETPPNASYREEIQITPAGEPSISVEYQYGKIPEVAKNDVPALTKLIDDVKQLESSMGSPQELVVFEVEGEAPPALPAALSDNIHIEHVKVSKKAILAFKKFTNEVLVKPDEMDWTMGTIWFLARFGISGTVWLSTPGVPVKLAIEMTIAGSLLTGFSSVMNKTYGNIFTYGINPGTDGKGYSKGQQLKIFGRQMLYDLTLSNMLNGLSGMRNTALQTSTNTAISAAAGNIFGVQKNLLFKDRRYLNNAVAVITSPIMFALQGLEASGHVATAFTVMSYQVRYSMLTTVSIYAGLIAFTHYKPEQALAFFEKIHAKIAPAILGLAQKARGMSKGFCSALLGGGSDELPGLN